MAARRGAVFESPLTPQSTRDTRALGTRILCRLPPDETGVTSDETGRRFVTMFERESQDTAYTPSLNLYFDFYFI